MNSKLYNEDIYYISDVNEKLPFHITIAGISYCDGSYHIVRNNSAVICIEFILDGCGTVCVDEKEYFPEKGDVYVLPMYKNHNYYSDTERPWTKIWFNASGPLIDAIVKAYGIQDLVIIKNSDSESYFREIIDLCKSIAPKSEINEKCALVFHRLIAHLSNISGINTPDISKEALKMKEYIDTHLGKNVSSEELSALIFKSKSQAIRIFKNEFGKTPYDYLLDKRLIQAKTLLKNTNLLIKEIAFRLGFSDEHYFSDLFKRKCGIAPRAYRNKK